MLALALVLAPAQAADDLPGLFAFSARPADTVVVEGTGYGAIVGLPFGAESAVGGMARGRIGLSRRVSVDLRAGGTHAEGCGVVPNGFDTRCRFETLVDGVARLGVAAIAAPRFRLVPYVGVGTSVEAGVAAWWQSVDERFELDVAWGPAWRTEALIPGEPGSWSEVNDPAPNLRIRPESSVPELGLTVHLDARDLHHLRFGHFAWVPTITYRADPGKLSLELTAGAMPFGAVLYGGAGGVF